MDVASVDISMDSPLITLGKSHISNVLVVDK